MNVARHRPCTDCVRHDALHGHRLRRAVGVTGLVVAAAVILTACSGVSPKLDQSSTTTTPSTSVTTTTHPKSPKPTTTQVALFFTRGTSLGVAHRSEPLASVRYDALRGLFAGPNPAEQVAGLGTVIPSGSLLEGLSFNGTLAYVDANTQFFSAASASVFTLRLAEVVYTLTEFTGVRDVQFYLHGATLPDIDGLPTSRGLTRTDLAAAIDDFLIVNPAVGDTITSPIAISGISDFSGTLEVQLTDGSGNLVVNTVATTTPGETFTYTYPFKASQVGSATLRVFAAPSGSSSSQLVASIPVTLSG